MKADPFDLFDIPLEGFGEMYKAMGRALWFCQCFEESLAYFLSLRFDIPQGTAEKIANKVLADKQRKTLGQLVRELANKECPFISEQLEIRLHEFTEERNWLAHRIQHQNHTDLYHRSKFRCLLIRLETLKNEAQALSKVFEKFLDDWYREQGLTEKELSHLMEKTMLEWKRA